ncbi:MAG: Fic family protein [Alphaproteobacteria bacterium]|nr:Fic family protein [Alphaproteobacteria bacterium]
MKAAGNAATIGQMLGIETIKISNETLSQICEIEEFKGLWGGLEAHTTGLSLLKEVAEFGGNFRKVLGPLAAQELTPAVIGTLHASQSKIPGVSPYRGGEYILKILKDGQETGALETAAPEDIKELTAKLVGWMNETLRQKDLHPLLAIAGFTAVFLQISPYETENLRLARFLVLVFMLKAGYSYAPYVSLEKVMNARAEEIYAALRHNQKSLEAGKPDWSEWVKCFLSLLQEQKNALRDKMYAKEKDLSHLPTLSGKILKLFEHHNRLQMKQIVKLTNGRRSTVKLRLGEMVDQGYVKRYGNARATWYSLV